MAYSDWKEIKVDVSDILLDYENPRVFIDDSTQENLLRFLVDEDESIELANQIYLNRGLPLAEKPVVTLEQDKYIVLEGNRRISACKLLLNPQLLTNKETIKIPKIDTEMENYLRNFPVVLAPDRDSAEAFITLRHSGDRSVKKWSTIASTKRFVNRYRKGESINHIARVLNEKNADVRKGIRFFFFLEFIRNEIEWNEEDKQKLEIYKMETTKLDRFLPFSKKAKDILKIDFTPDQYIKTELPMEIFKAALKNIVSRIYLKNEIDTRTNMNVVFNSEIIEMCKLPLMNKGDGNTTVNESIGTKGTGSTAGTEEEPIGAKGTGSTAGTEEGPIGTKGTGSTEEGPIGTKGTGSTAGTEEGPIGTKGTGSTAGTEEGPIGAKGTGPTAGTEEGPIGAKETGPTAGTIRSANDVGRYVNLTGAYPFTNKYQKNKRINTLLKEIKSSKYKENRMGSMYLIRSLLETYTHEYIDYFVKDDMKEYRIKGVARERTKRSQKLRELIYNNIKDHLKKFYPQYEEEIELIEITFTENNNAAATRIINFYIHSQTQVPDYQELLDAWKKVSTILKCLDEILFTNMSLLD
ncbi:MULTISPECIES: hypothetical protein [Bacillus]|uniref:hypothetical protein n=1 Tax=Bacillus TaxID=1386 RepID=UPI00105F7903|nr:MULTISPECIES: hypothetical protein [Bacillus]MCZ8479229.1 hypothetical protein [Bacillus subtilis]MDD9775149.1 hypothetical protein [Bacillus subtilis]MDD9779450.1 hypothetical protein [Bacillus subtilis]TDO87417.1 hypothetical protein BDW29_3271 [Bacillus sp. AtDRG31]